MSDQIDLGKSDQPGLVADKAKSTPAGVESTSGQGDKSKSRASDPEDSLDKEIDPGSTDDTIVKKKPSKGKAKRKSIRIESSRSRSRSESSSSSSTGGSTTSSTELSDDERDHRRKRYKKRKYPSKKKVKRYYKSKRRDRSRSRRRRSRSRSKPRRSRSRRDSSVDDLENHPDFAAKVEQAVRKRLEHLAKRKETKRGAETSEDESSGKLRSPSDSLLYTPAVKRRMARSGIRSPQFYNDNTENNLVQEFIKRVRLDVSGDAGRAETDVEKDKGSSAENECDADEVATARQQAEQAVLDAERYKASLNPKGKEASVVKQLTEDDEFFHITCHVEESLRAKCARGEFIELEKLLPKMKLHGKKSEAAYDQRYEIVSKDGHAYVVPFTDKDNKISNIRRWEQAFRIYAALYSQANPARAAEIWQYVHIINTAASSYVWENVACYDMTFRHLMSSNPQRSWAKIYTQGWSLAMRDPLPMNRGGGLYQGTPGKFTGKPGKTGVCWRYNRNKCGFGTKCRFEHKCSYCGGSHMAINCPKKQNKKPSAASGGTPPAEGNAPN